MIMHYCDFPNNQRKEYNKNTEGGNAIITMVCSMIIFNLVIQNIVNEFTKIKSQMFALRLVQTKICKKLM